MQLTYSMKIGAGLGFLFGIIFAVVSAFRFDETRTSASETVLVGLVIGLPIAVMFGVFGGWLWDVFFKIKEE